MLLMCTHTYTHTHTLQVVSQYSNQLAPLSVDAVLKVIDPATATNVDLRDIKVIKKLG
jgi:T-complex protein 1 subunit delta